MNNDDNDHAIQNDAILIANYRRKEKGKKKWILGSVQINALSVTYLHYQQNLVKIPFLWKIRKCVTGRSPHMTVVLSMKRLNGEFGHPGANRERTLQQHAGV